MSNKKYEQDDLIYDPWNDVHDICLTSVDNGIWYKVIELSTDAIDISPVANLATAIHWALSDVE